MRRRINNTLDGIDVNDSVAPRIFQKNRNFRYLANELQVIIHLERENSPLHHSKRFVYDYI